MKEIGISKRVEFELVSIDIGIHQRSKRNIEGLKRNRGGAQRHRDVYGRTESSKDQPYIVSKGRETGREEPTSEAPQYQTEVE